MARYSIVGSALEARVHKESSPNHVIANDQEWDAPESHESAVLVGNAGFPRDYKARPYQGKRYCDPIIGVEDYLWVGHSSPIESFVRR